MSKPTLSIAISEKNLGLAVFQEQQLTFLEAHSLAGVPKPAEASAGFIFRAMDSFNPDTAVLQCSPEEPENIRAAILEALHTANCPVQEISEQQVLASFGDPPIESKEELRYLMRVLFPQLPVTRLVFSCLDAVATGLYFETQRLLADDQ